MIEDELGFTYMFVDDLGLHAWLFIEFWWKLMLDRLLNSCLDDCNSMLMLCFDDIVDSKVY